MPPLIPIDADDDVPIPSFAEAPSAFVLLKRMILSKRGYVLNQTTCQLFLA